MRPSGYGNRPRHGLLPPRWAVTPDTIEHAPGALRQRRRAGDPTAYPQKNRVPVGKARMEGLTVRRAPLSVTILLAASAFWELWPLSDLERLFVIHAI